VFYCIGLTANFRQQPFATLDAHVWVLRQLLEFGRFESLTYLSSTRVYECANSTQESALLPVTPENAGHLYNISKLMGESLCLASGRNTKIVRLANVVGTGMTGQNFLTQVMTEAVKTGEVTLMTSANSAKDYVLIADVVRWLPDIALHGKHAIYNVASGINTSNAELADLLTAQGIHVHFAEDAPDWLFPVIATQRLRQEFAPAQHTLAQEFTVIFDDSKRRNRE
jgi:nucleoside-diphosphate-sugar epimerase